MRTLHTRTFVSRHTTDRQTDAESTLLGCVW